MKISLIQPGRNNLKYLKWSYDSIRKNQGRHEVEICVADDFSSDGTWDWCQETMKKDSNFKAIRNEGPTRLGHTILYDRLVNEVASHDICMIYHADMYLCPGALDEIEKRICPGLIVSLTRIEPPLHPDGPEKILKDFGIEPEEFQEEELLNFLDRNEKLLARVTYGVFAPWAFYKKDFQEIGGHDPLYAPQSKEDSDIFNRFKLNGVNFLQTWAGCVYHMTCRGSRFADGAKRNPDGKVFMKNRETDEWLEQNKRSTRNFIRKWGHFVKHDDHLYPIVPPKYNIGIVVKNCTEEMLNSLEPWCDRIYTDIEYNNYITKEQPNTKFNLKERIFSINAEVIDDIEVRIDGLTLTQNDYKYITELSTIIQESDISEKEFGSEFEVGHLKLMVNNLNTYEKDLVVCKES